MYAGVFKSLATIAPSTSLCTFSIMKSPLALWVLASIVQAEISKETMEGIHAYNFRSKCWGQKNIDGWSGQIEAAKKSCLQQEPALDLAPPLNPFSSNNIFEKLQAGGSLWRNKRGAGDEGGILDLDDNMFYEFVQQVREHKEDKMAMMGNLTCVLTKLKMLTPEREINIEFYTTYLTEPQEVEEGEDQVEWPEDSAAADPAWRHKMSEYNQDCYKLSQTFPQVALNRNPMSRMFGRHMVFFKCAHVSSEVVSAHMVFLNPSTPLYQWFLFL